jgi:hypothetical protein
MFIFTALAVKIGVKMVGSKWGGSFRVFFYCLGGKKGDGNSLPYLPTEAELVAEMA